jgi:tetratricopeptide (TPR) repeat protein
MKNKTIVFLALLVLILAQSVLAQTDVKDFLQKAEEFDQENKFPEAIGEMSKAIDAQPSDANLYLRRAKLNFAAGNHKAVAGDVGKAIALKPADKRTLLDAVQLLRYVKQCPESLDLIDDFTAKNAVNDDIYYSRSHSKMCLDDWSGAYEDLFKASELSPANTMYRSTLAAMLAKLGDSDQALKQFERLIKFYEANFARIKAVYPKITQNHDLSEVYRLRAGVFHAKNDSIAEFADLARFIEYEPRDFSYRVRAKIYLDHDMFTEAIADYTEALKNTLNPSIFLFERGDVYARAGKYEEAIRDYEETLKKDATLENQVNQRIAATKRKRQASKSQPK